MPDVVTHLQTSNVRLTPAQSADLIRDYLAGAAAKHLSERYGLSPRAVRSHIHRAGIPLRPKVMLTRSQAAELVELYGQGWTGADLAARFSFSERTVFLELKRADVPSRPRGRHRTARTTDALTTQPAGATKNQNVEEPDRPGHHHGLNARRRNQLTRQRLKSGDGGSGLMQEVRRIDVSQEVAPLADGIGLDAAQ